LGELVRIAARMRVREDSGETRGLVCQLAAQLADGAGAVLYLAEPGRLVASAGAGTYPAPPRGELDVDLRVERAVRDGEVVDDADLVAAPILGEASVLGAVAVFGAGRLDDATRDGLRLFGSLAGGLFERIGSVVPVGEVDPLTGVGDRSRGAAALASVRPGDGVVLCEIDDLVGLRSRDAGTADLTMGRFGLHLRNAIRPGDVVARSHELAFVLVLRQLRAPIDVVVQRVLGGWQAMAPTATVSVGAALHLERATPVDTADEALRMLRAAQDSGTGRLYVAPVQA
jgi:hypothetical protein